MFDHPSLVVDNYTTSILAWSDGGLRFLEAPREGGVILLDAYYGSYLAAFVLGYFIIRGMVRRGSLKLKDYQAYDLLLVAMLGVLIGAKTVYVLFYNLDYYREHPADIVLNWSGMASHGAMLGVLVGMLIWTWRIKRPFLHVTDAIAVCAPLGVFFVRIANFLNGELCGRSANPATVPWAMRFPMHDGQGQTLYATVSKTASGETQHHVYALQHFNEQHERVQGHLIEVKAAALHPFEVFRPDDPQKFPVGAPNASARETVYRIVTDASHPVQLYEMLIGGVLLFMVMLMVRKRARSVGTATATFLIGYGCVRTVMEALRQPDPQVGFLVAPWHWFPGITMGQTLSFCIISGGIAILAWRRGRPLAIADIAPVMPIQH